MVPNIYQVLLSILHPVDAYSPQPYDVGVRTIPFFTSEMCKGFPKSRHPLRVRCQDLSSVCVLLERLLLTMTLPISTGASQSLCFLINKSEPKQWEDSKPRRQNIQAKITTISLKSPTSFVWNKILWKIVYLSEPLTVNQKVNNRSLASDQDTCGHILLSCVTNHSFLPANILLRVQLGVPREHGAQGSGHPKAPRHREAEGRCWAGPRGSEWGFGHALWRWSRPAHRKGECMHEKTDAQII